MLARATLNVTQPFSTVDNFQSTVKYQPTVSKSASRRGVNYHRPMGAIMPTHNQPLVYFFAKSNFGDDQSDFVKIGYTSKDLSLRQAALQTGNEAPIREIGVIPFETEDEAREEEETNPLSV